MKVKAVYGIAVIIVLFFSCPLATAQKSVYRTNYKAYSSELLSMAEKGDVRAMNDLGSCYDRGSGVAQNREEAFKWFKKSAEKNNLLAQYNLGLYYEKNYVKADDTDPNLYFAITSNPLKSPNLVAARHWYLKSAEQGFLGAMMKAAIYLDQGTGGEKDFDKAQFYYEQLVKTIPNAYYYLRIGKIAEDKGDVSKAVANYEKAMGMGDCVSCILLGALYQNGTKVSKDLSKAFDCYSKATELNYPLGYYLRGNMYFRGDYVRQDYEKAFSDFKKAADMGCVEALCSMGFESYSGEHIEKNYGDAVYYFEKALKVKHLPDVAKGSVLMKLSSCYRYGLGVATDVQKANELIKEAEKYGNADARALQQWLNH